MRLFYLDQNVANPASEDNEKFKKISDIVYPHGNKIEKKLEITPFSLLEFSGATVSDLFLRQEFSLPQNPNYETLVPKAFDFYTKNIRKDLTGYLLKELEKRRLYKKTLLGKCLINEYRNYIHEERFKNEMIHTFAIDRVSKINYSQVKDKDVYKKLIASAIRIVRDNTNINMVRLAFKSFKCSMENERNTEERDIQEKNYECIKFKENTDTVDTEIVHLACFGRDSQPIKIITADDKSIIEGRVWFYRKILKTSSEANNISLNFCKDFEIEFLDMKTFESIGRINLTDIESISK